MGGGDTFPIRRGGIYHHHQQHHYQHHQTLPQSQQQPRKQQQQPLQVLLEDSTTTRATTLVNTMATMNTNTNTSTNTQTPILEEYTGNPLFSGWYADPEVRIFESQYWIYPSVSDAYERQTYFDCFSSPDLVHWTKHPRILDFADIPWSTYRAAWAPAVAYKNGKYYMYFSAGDGAPGAGIGVAVADRPHGPFRDVLGRALVSKTVHGAEAIDPAIFIDDEDRPEEEGDHSVGPVGRKKRRSRNYLFWGGWSHCVAAELGDDMVTFKSDIVEITPPYYVEAPWMLKRNGVYYFMYSVGGWTDNSYGVEYVTSTVSPMGPFGRNSIRILSPDPRVGKGVGSHSVLRVKRKKSHDTKTVKEEDKGEDAYYIVYHRRPVDDTHPNHRQVCIDQLEFDDEGRILPVKITNRGVLGHVLDD